MNTESSALRLSGLSKSFRSDDGGRLEVLADVSFEVRRGEILGLVGPSGCGKTTMLEIIAGLQNPDDGEVVLATDRSTNCLTLWPAMVFQDYTRSLLPFQRVSGNIRFALSALGLTKAEVKDRLSEVLLVTHLQDFSDYYPWQLSGGMQQRVALARALALRSSVLLLDEPFASIDQETQYILEDKVLQLATQSGLTILYVAHDLDSVVYCSTRCLALSQRPARILEEITIDLPWPRSQDQTRSNPKFIAYRTQLYRLMKNEIMNHAYKKST